MTIGIRVLAASWAYVAVGQKDKNPNAKRDAERLLHKAARLESVDREQAITVYREILRQYPNTPASAEASQNIHALKKNG